MKDEMSKERITLSDIIRQNLQDLKEQEFILQIPLIEEVIQHEGKV